MSNNCSIPADRLSIPARAILAQFIQSNLEIVEAREASLLRRAGLFQFGDVPFKDKLHALADLVSAPFIRLGKKFRESPITCEITAAARRFNNLLSFCKQQATQYILNDAAHKDESPEYQRMLDRIGLRLRIMKVDLAELVAEDEADQPPDAEALNTKNATCAPKSEPTPAVAAAKPPPQPATQPAAAADRATPTPRELEISQLLDQSASPAATASETSTTTRQSPPRGKPFGLPINPNNKRNRFKKRRRA